MFDHKNVFKEPLPLVFIIINFGEENFVINRGDRIAQMIISPVAKACWNEVSSLDETRRGKGGFGHTGL